jgi:phage terminase large subunit
VSGLTLKLAPAKVFKPLYQQARYKGAHGGRGSGKSHDAAERLLMRALTDHGHRGVCIREVQKTLKESSKRLIEDKLIQMRLGQAQGFKVFNEVIQTPGDGIIVFQGMQDSNAESIKSLEGFQTAWCEEAQTMSARSLQLLRPTIRAENSELWFTWNPRRKTDPVDVLFRGDSPPTGAVSVQANWRDNPLFPDVLEIERQDCLRNEPDQYDHVWEGGYANLLVGAYYAMSITMAKMQGRIGRVGHDPLLPYKVFVDIGGTGARSDAFTMWVCQFVGRSILVLDYYEAVGQPSGTHLEWLRTRDFTNTKAEIYLPHDGATQDKVIDVSYESTFEDAGYEVTVVPNQGRGAASQRIESGRRMFPSCWFHQETTQPGLDALGWYHEKRDLARGIGLGPEHDWASHGSDSFGMMCIVAEDQFKSTVRGRQGKVITSAHGTLGGPRDDDWLAAARELDS